MEGPWRVWWINAWNPRHEGLGRGLGGDLLNGIRVGSHPVRQRRHPDLFLGTLGGHDPSAHPSGDDRNPVLGKFVDEEVPVVALEALLAEDGDQFGVTREAVEPLRRVQRFVSSHTSIALGPVRLSGSGSPEGVRGMAHPLDSNWSCHRPMAIRLFLASLILIGRDPRLAVPTCDEPDRADGRE